MEHNAINEKNFVHSIRILSISSLDKTTRIKTSNFDDFPFFPVGTIINGIYVKIFTIVYIAIYE